MARISRSSAVQARSWSTPIRSSAAPATVASIAPSPRTSRVVAHALEQPVGDARRAARAVGDRARAGGVDRHAEHAGAAHDDPREVARARSGSSRCWIPKRSRSGEVSRPARVVAPISVKRRQVERDHLRARPDAERDRQLAVLHRGIERLLHRAREPVDLVDEEDGARLEVGEVGGDVALALQRRARRSGRTGRRAPRRRSAPGSSCPGPGGPASSTWSSASPRAAAAAIETASCSLSSVLADELVEPLRAQRRVELVLGALVRRLEPVDARACGSSPARHLQRVGDQRPRASRRRRRRAAPRPPGASSRGRRGRRGRAAAGRRRARPRSGRPRARRRPSRAARRRSARRCACRSPARPAAARCRRPRPRRAARAACRRDSTASATFGPTDWTPISSRKRSRSASDAKP